MALAAALLAPASYAWGADADFPAPLQDRGTGLATSQFGTYVRKGELLVYPSFEYYRDSDLEYNPADFGFPSEREFRGRYRASEEVLFLAYGLSDRLAVQFEGAAIQASLRKAAGDRSGLPARLSESGLGDVQARLTWRWLEESGRRPEIFSYSEVFFPHDRHKPLIGTPDWVVDTGLGAIRGFRWGTVTLRAGFLYEAGSASTIDWSEIAVEYLKRLSPRITLFGALVMLQGDEGTLVTELQWHLSPHVVVRLNNGLGLTPLAPDWAPEVGVLFRFPRR
jgi:hypothetical protein